MNDSVTFEATISSKQVAEGESSSDPRLRVPRYAPSHEARPTPAPWLGTVILGPLHGTPVGRVVPPTPRWRAGV